MRHGEAMLARSYDTREWRAWRQRRARRVAVAAGCALLFVCALFAML